MAEFRLKSFHFRREREATWRALDELVGRAEKRGVKTLSSTELVRLPSLYFATLSSLSVARSISLDRNVVEYLESLASRSFFLVYGSRTNLWEAIIDFFVWRLPAAVRRLIAVQEWMTAARLETAFVAADEPYAEAKSPTARS